MSDDQPRELGIPDHFATDDTGHEACSRALGQVHAFLHGELCEADEDLIRMHLETCEKCFEDFDIEQTISALLKRCHQPAPASTQLRMRIVSMSMTLHPPHQAS